MNNGVRAQWDLGETRTARRTMVDMLQQHMI